MSDFQKYTFKINSPFKLNCYHQYFLIQVSFQRMIIHHKNLFNLIKYSSNCIRHRKSTIEVVTEHVTPLNWKENLTVYHKYYEICIRQNINNNINSILIFI